MKNNFATIQLLTRLQLPNILYFKVYLKPHIHYETAYFFPLYKILLLFLMLVL